MQITIVGTHMQPFTLWLQVSVHNFKMVDHYIYSAELYRSQGLLTYLSGVNILSSSNASHFFLLTTDARPDKQLKI